MQHGFCRINMHRAAFTSAGVEVLGLGNSKHVVKYALSHHCQCPHTRLQQRSLGWKPGNGKGTSRLDAWREDRLGKGADPGSWNFSPEWMGTQGGGWGHNEGDTVFAEMSHHRNGLVNVTRHYASKQDSVPLFQSAVAPRDSDQLKKRLKEVIDASQSVYEEWRVLRFNDTTVQSVARTIVGETNDGEVAVVQRGDCMAFLYMQTIAAAVASLVGLAPEGSSLRGALKPFDPESPCRVLCIGLGGGSLPLFLAHHYPGMLIDVVELDPTVIKATTAMGFAERGRLVVHEGDAVDWLQQYQQEGGPPLDLVFVDAFDGDNRIPAAFKQSGQPFMEDLQAALHPENGVAIVNLHRGDLPPLWKQVMLKLNGRPWIDPIIEPVADVYKECVTPNKTGVTYTLQVGPQYNVILVAARGRHLAASEDLSKDLKQAAKEIADLSKYRFNAADKSVLDFRES